MKSAFVAKLSLAALVAVSGTVFAQESEEAVTEIAEVAEVVADDAQESVSDTVVAETAEATVMTEGEVVAPPMASVAEMGTVLPMLPMVSDCAGCGQVVSAPVFNQPVYETPMYSTGVYNAGTVSTVGCGGCGQAVYATPVNNCGCNTGCIGPVSYTHLTLPTKA